MDAERYLGSQGLENCLLARILRGEADHTTARSMAIVDAQASLARTSSDAHQAHQRQRTLLDLLLEDPRYQQIAALPVLRPTEPRTPSSAYDALTVQRCNLAEDLSRTIIAAHVISISPGTDDIAHCGRLVASLVIHSGVINKTILNALISQIGEMPAYDENWLPYYDLWLPIGRRPRQEFRRVYISPVCEAILLRLSDSQRLHLAGTRDNRRALWRAAQAFLTAAGVSTTRSLSALFLIARAAVAVRCSPLIHDYLARGQISHSLRSSAGRSPYFDSTGHAGLDTADNADQLIQYRHSAKRPVASWYHDIRRILVDLDRKANSRAATIKALVGQNTSPAYNYDFRAELLSGFAAHRLSNSALRPRTLLNTLSLLYDYLLDQFAQDPRTMAPADLEDAYSDSVNLCPAAGRRRQLCSAVVVFHQYLRESFEAPEVDLTNIRWCAGGLAAVDAAVISESVYLRAMQSLDIKAGDVDASVITVAKMILTLGYRTGPRRREIWALRACDVHHFHTPCVLIRRHSDWTPKTRNAERTIPIGTLMLPEEVYRLVQWAERRRAEGGPFAPLFALPGTLDHPDADRGVYDLIHGALRHASGSSSLHFHLLRHTAATRLAAILMLTASEARRTWLADIMPSAWDDACFDTIRKALHGHPHESRRAAYSLCRVLGHGSPATSFEHYTHCLDVISHLRLRRAYPVTPVELGLAGGLGKTQAYEAAGLGGEAEVLRRLRKRAGIFACRAAHRAEPTREIDLMARVRSAIYLGRQLDASATEICAAVSIDEQTIVRLNDAARYFLSTSRRRPFSEQFPDTTQTRMTKAATPDLLPPLPKGDNNRDFASSLFTHLIERAQYDAVSRSAIYAYARRYRASHDAAIFHDYKRDANDARGLFQVIHGLRGVGVSVSLSSFNSAVNDPFVRRWRSALQVPRCIPVVSRRASSGKHDSPRHWLGIQPVAAESEVASHTNRSVSYAFWLAAIYLRATDPDFPV